MYSVHLCHARASHLWRRWGFTETWVAGCIPSCYSLAASSFFFWGQRRIEWAHDPRWWRRSQLSSPRVSLGWSCGRLSFLHTVLRVAECHRPRLQGSHPGHDKFGSSKAGDSVRSAGASLVCWLWDWLEVLETRVLSLLQISRRRGTSRYSSCHITQLLISRCRGTLLMRISTVPT